MDSPPIAKSWCEGMPARYLAQCTVGDFVVICWLGNRGEQKTPVVATAARLKNRR